MTGYIQRIHTKIPFTDKIVNIDLQGKNLILTGGNGCGKTNFLNHLFDYLTRRVVNRENNQRDQLENDIRHYSEVITRSGEAHQFYPNWKNNLIDSRRKLEEIDNPVLSLNSLETFVVNYHSNRALLT
ncbi:hypothetical protein WAE56_21160, partial [Iodobacter sp. LRB]